MTACLILIVFNDSDGFELPLKCSVGAIRKTKVACHFCRMPALLWDEVSHSWKYLRMQSDYQSWVLYHPFRCLHDAALAGDFFSRHAMSAFSLKNGVPAAVRCAFFEWSVCFLSQQRTVDLHAFTFYLILPTFFLQVPGNTFCFPVFVEIKTMMWISTRQYLFKHTCVSVGLLFLCRWNISQMSGF